MKINNIIKINFLFVILSLFACESLEDTYKDYSGDGKIKYVGKCESFTVSAGWKRFVFDWKPSSDPNIKEVQIHWSREGEKGVFTVPIGVNTFSTEATFGDYPYTFECYGVDVDGDLSIPLIEYSQPYTYNHELILGSPKIVNKYFFLGNDKTGHDLVIFLDAYSENITSAIITYYQNGVQKEMEITVDMFKKGNITIENIDFAKDIIVNRVARVEGCLDEITFEPYVLNHNVFNINFDFSQEIKNRYNLNELSPEFINNLEVLELDYSLKSMEDVMYFPNLKKIILGGNRFMITLTSDYPMRSSLDYSNRANSILALNNVIRKLGVELTIYNDHYYIGSKFPSAIKKGDPNLPDLQYLNTEGWSVKSSTNESSDENLDVAQPENILDNDQSTLWHPQSVKNDIRTHELIIDMKSGKTVNGFKISQPIKNSDVEQIYYSDIIRIELSNDNLIWENALLQIQSTIGLNYGESTVFYTYEPKVARYIKIVMTDKFDPAYKRNNSCLGDFMVF